MKKVIATTDIIVKHKNNILLIKRKFNPFKNYWALPGGHIDVTDKDIVSCAQRELKEETNIDIPLSNLHYKVTIGNNKRDPRGFALTNVFLVCINSIPENIMAQDDASDLQWFDIHNLPTDIDFDHSHIINDLIFI